MKAVTTNDRFFFHGETVPMGTEFNVTKIEGDLHKRGFVKLHTNCKIDPGFWIIYHKEELKKFGIKLYGKL